MTETRRPVAEGGCQCGAVRYAFFTPLENSHVCHCRMCQRATGGLFAALAGARKGDFAWTRGDARVYASSNLASRAYCGDCGTPLTFAYNLPEARVYVTIGSLDAPAAAPIVKQYGIESRLPWVRFCEDAPAEETGVGADAQAYLAQMVKHQG